jgi:predicted nucleic acid-binding protein
MLSEIRLIYWDACVPLAYINGEQARLAHLEGLLQKSGKDFQLITSVYTVTEVSFAKREQDQKALSNDIEDKIAKLWLPGSPIQLVEFYELIAAKAARLIRIAIPKGWQLKPGDAIHLATADHLKVSEFQTYDDGLDKFSAITDTQYSICRPIAEQPVIVLTKHEEQKTNDRAATSTTPVQGGSSGPLAGQTGTETKGEAQEKTEG